MRQGQGSVGQLVLGLILIGLITWGVFALFTNLPKEILVAAITISGSAIVAVMQLTRTRQKEIEQDIRKQKSPIYEDFIEFLLKEGFLKDVMREAETKPEDERKMSEAILRFTHKVIVWGSDEVVKEYSNLKRSLAPAVEKSSETPTPEIERMFAFEKLMLTMRKDIGHQNRGLVKGDLLAMFVNDIDKYL